MKKILLLSMLASTLIVSCGLLESEEEHSEDSFSFDGLADSNEKTTGAVKKYNIKFVDHDGTLLDSMEVDGGTVPKTSIVPTREGDEEYAYTFASWTPTPYSANKDQVYKAAYTRTKQVYEVDFVSDIGSLVLDTQYVEYGERPEYKKLPDKSTGLVHVGYSTERYTGPEITKKEDFNVVTKNDRYYAVYQSIEDINISYSVTFYLTENGSSGSVKTTSVKRQVVPDFASLYPDVEIKAATTIYQNEFKYYRFVNWYNGTLNKDQMLGKASITDKTKIGLKPATSDTFYYPMFEEVNLFTEYPDGFISYLKDANSSDISVISWNDLITNEYISVSGNTLIPNTSKLFQLNNIYFIVNKNITTIPEDGFSGLSTLRYISLPESITSLGKRCFKNCSKLSVISNGSYPSFIIPKNVTVIPEYIFDGCSLSDFTYLGDNLSKIEANAFYGASNYSSISLRFRNYSYDDLINSGALTSSWYGNKSVNVFFSDNTFRTFPQ